MNLQILATGVRVSYNDVGCKGINPMNRIALAITTNPKKRISPQIDDYEFLPTQIQLCPWFVEWIKQRRPDDITWGEWAGIKKKTRIGRYFISKAEDNKLLFNQIGESIFVLEC